jgi:hypothetical protein
MLIEFDKAYDKFTGKFIYIKLWYMKASPLG